MLSQTTGIVNGFESLCRDCAVMKHAKHQGMDRIGVAARVSALRRKRRSSFDSAYQLVEAAARRLLDHIRAEQDLS